MNDLDRSLKIVLCLMAAGATAAPALAQTASEENAAVTELEANWMPVDAMRLTLGVETAFDREVPFVKLLNGYNSSENDLRGRFVYARVAVDF